VRVSARCPEYIYKDWVIIWIDRIGTMHSYSYKQFRIALSAHRDGDHGYFNVSGKIRFGEIEAVPAMNFFISSYRFRSPEDAYVAGKQNAETWVDQQL
jgi:hypothetical protein